ncbi:MAG: DNA cytosine methyltransferase, partial [Eggerthellaceae bacterium]|nr:DNA cytosine methyltransferase [Eggerthellaceae bacterium]
QNLHVVTCDAVEDYQGSRKTLGDVIVSASEVPDEFYIPKNKLEKWRYLKGSKSEERTKKAADGTVFTYHYSEGSMAFPDLLTNPSRTILTGEGGAGASRFKHVVEIDGRYRRLVPDELDQLQGFPKGWTDTGMSDGHRAFCMGNALVVGIPHLIGKELASYL